MANIHEVLSMTGLDYTRYQDARRAPCVQVQEEKEGSGGGPRSDDLIRPSSEQWKNRKKEKRRTKIMI